MKRMLLFFACVFLLFIANSSYASAVPAPGGTTVAPGKLTVKDVLRLSPRQLEQLTGRKLNFKDRVAYKLLQWKLRHASHDEPTERQKRQGRLALIFGSAAIVFLLVPGLGIFGVGLAIAGLIIGLKSINGNSNTAGLIGVIFSALVLLIFIAAVAIVASFLSGGF